MDKKEDIYTFFVTQQQYTKSLKREGQNKELHLNAQTGEYDIEHMVLNLGSEVNVMTKQTGALMGKPKLIYSPIRLRMDN